jgi:predicted PurR-regulated permease PerM
MNEIKKNWTKWLYWFLFAVAVIAVYKTLDNFNDIASWIGNFFGIITPFLAGILIAYILYLPTKKMETTYKKSKIKLISKNYTKLAVFTVYLITILIIIILINVILPVVFDSILELTNNFQEYLKIAMQRYQELPEDSILKGDLVNELIENVQAFDIKQYININKITDYAKGAINFASVIFDIFVSLIVSVYILLERKEILAFIKKLAGAIFEKKTYDNLENYFEQTNVIFFKFLASQFLDAIVVGILTTIAMGIMKVKYAPLLGFMIGLFNMIPYFGAIIAVVIAAIITLITGGLSQAIWMIIVVTILQQIDANIINPKIVGDSLRISPILVILAVTIGGAYFGVLGMFLGVPVIAVIKIIINDYIEYKNKIKEEN